MMSASENIDEILKSLDQIKRAPAPPYLYSKIKNRCIHADSKGPEKSLLEWLTEFISKPVLNFLILLFFLIIDCVAIHIRENSSKGGGTVITEDEIIFGLPFTDQLTGEFGNDIYF